VRRLLAKGGGQLADGAGLAAAVNVVPHFCIYFSLKIKLKMNK
jgi:hypothetical protein